MPWKENSIMDERMRFVTRLREGERMSDLCREYGISRKTGYKFWNRYKKYGVPAFEDQSRKPQRSPGRIGPEVEKVILDIKQQFPSWGAKKLRERLCTHHPGLRVPARSTIDSMMRRHGLVRTRKRRRRAKPVGTILRQSSYPNEVWCADFKGQFRLGNGKYCYPLTVTDHFSRFILCCDGMEGTRLEEAKESFEEVFCANGLPDAIRTDNGLPFASTGLAGLTRLSAWWLKLGIELERISPGHPEENGRHERMHWTLKAETTRPAGKNMLQQQERFDQFLEVFNVERPHEALGMKTPTSMYNTSAKAYQGTPELEYPLHDDVRKVARGGHVQLGGRRHPHFFLSNALAGEYVGVREIEPKQWLVTFAKYDLGVIDLEKKAFTAFEPNNTEEIPSVGHAS